MASFYEDLTDYEIRENSNSLEGSVKKFLSGYITDTDNITYELLLIDLLKQIRDLHINSLSCESSIKMTKKALDESLKKAKFNLNQYQNATETTNSLNKSAIEATPEEALVMRNVCDYLLTGVMRDNLGAYEVNSRDVERLTNNLIDLRNNKKNIDSTMSKKIDELLATYYLIDGYGIDPLKQIYSNSNVMKDLTYKEANPDSTLATYLHYAITGIFGDADNDFHITNQIIGIIAKENRNLIDTYKFVGDIAKQCEQPIAGNIPKQIKEYVDVHDFTDSEKYLLCKRAANNIRLRKNFNRK
ncbi:MAG TPA: hypothetical protein PLC25_04835 [Bacilli bacterium]|nr:hypothetical protein [Bacilli bacterium]